MLNALEKRVDCTTKRCLHYNGRRGGCARSWLQLCVIQSFRKVSLLVSNDGLSFSLAYQTVIQLTCDKLITSFVNILKLHCLNCYTTVIFRSSVIVLDTIICAAFCNTTRKTDILLLYNCYTTVIHANVLHFSRQSTHKKHPTRLHQPQRG